MNKELCIKLKEAGFAQEIDGLSFAYDDIMGRVFVIKFIYNAAKILKDGSVYYTTITDYIKIPSSDDLARALPKEIIVDDIRYNIAWNSISSDIFYISHDGCYRPLFITPFDFHNPSEGYANLWLELRKEGLV